MTSEVSKKLSANSGGYSTQKEVSTAVFSFMVGSTCVLMFLSFLQFMSYSLLTDKTETMRVAAHERLGEVLRILRSILEKYPPIQSTELLMTAGTLIQQVKGMIPSHSFEIIRKLFFEGGGGTAIQVKHFLEKSSFRVNLLREGVIIFRGLIQGACVYDISYIKVLSLGTILPLI